MAKRHERRSPWGEQDQIGAMNYVTPEMPVRLFQGVKKRVYEFLFILLLVKYKGATASPVRPMAVR